MEQKNISQSIKSIAWGYVLIHLHFNIGTLDLLPDWLGCLFFLDALPVLAQFVPSAILLKPFALVLTIWAGIDWILTLFSISFDVYLLTLLISLIGLYFHFQLLTNLAELAKQNNCPQEKSILILRTIRTIFATISILPLPWEQYEILFFIFIGIQLILVACLCSVLFSFAKSLQETINIEE